jgi:uncharacterized protein YjbI with pentapeptide repeats
VPAEPDDADKVANQANIPGISRKKLSARDLKRAVARHRGWLVNPQGKGVLPPPEPLPKQDLFLDFCPPDDLDWRDEALRNPEQADLSLYDLADAEFPNANLNGTILVDTILTGAQFNNASLIAANLTGANLAGASLFGARLIRTRLMGANLSRANLVISKLIKADLRGAKLIASELNSADLTQANLRGANVAGAMLAYTTLTNAVYAPQSEPPHPYVAGIKGVLKVRVPSGERVGLVQLRKLFQEAGLRDLEREATCRIERADTADWKGLSSAIRSVLRWIAFDLTTAYGLQPFRALLLIIGFWALFTSIYCWPIISTPGQSEQVSGIYKILPEKRIAGPAGNPHIEPNSDVHRIHAANVQEAIPSAAYFSLLSGANIGFQQFTPGDWIRRLQRHDYELRAEGWVRRVAGAQALLSVFLLAMWVLTQFGRPFQ